MTRRTTICLTLLAAVVLAASADAEWVWRQDSGWVNTGGDQPRTIDEALRYCAAQIALGNYASALERIRGLARRPLSKQEKGQAAVLEAECLTHMRRYEQAATLLNTIAPALGEELAAARDALRLKVASRCTETNPDIAKELLDGLLGYDKSTAPRQAWTQQDLLDAAEAYRDIEAWDRTLDTVQRFRVAFPDSPLLAETYYLSARVRAHAAAEANAAGAPPRQAAADYKAYLKAAPNTARRTNIVECVEVLEHAAVERSPKMRQVLYAYYRIRNGEAAEVYDTLMRLAESAPRTEVGEAAAFYRILALDALNDPKAEAEAAEDFMATYPASTYYDRVSRLGYAATQTVLTHGEESGLAHVDAIYERDPKGPLADDALMAKARYMMSQKRYPEAVRLFKSVLEDYPASENAAEALYRLGVATLNQSEYHPERQAIYRRAREAFELYVKRYPHGEYVEEAQRHIARCRRIEVQHLRDVAEFYLKQGKPQSANVYLRMIQRDFPEVDLRELKPTNKR